MEDLELLQQVFSRRMRWVREDAGTVQEGFRRPLPRERLGDPGVAGALALARRAMEAVPDVRRDVVASVRRQLQAGSLPVDAGSLADRLLHETVLNELT